MDIEEQYNRIYRYCYMKTRDHHTSEDLTQETFLHFLENKIQEAVRLSQQEAEEKE